MKRWHKGESRNREESSKIRAFMNDLEVLFTQHKMVLGHEDAHGAFLIEPLTKDGLDWIRQAHVSKRLTD